MACFMSGCSKDENGAPELLDLKQFYGSWCFEEDITLENAHFHAGHYDGDVNEVLGTRIIRLDIAVDDSFKWVEEEHWFTMFDGRTDSISTQGKIERTADKLSFIFDKWYYGEPGRVFTYQLTPDGKELTLFGQTSGYQPLETSMTFRRQ